MFEFFKRRIEISYPLDEGVHDVLESQRAAHEVRGLSGVFSVSLVTTFSLDFLG